VEASKPNSTNPRQQAQKLSQEGNYNDAYQIFRTLALDPATDARQVGSDLEMALQCLQQLGRVDEADELVEAAIQTHAQNWRLLWAAARSYMGLPHHGFMVAGKFHRGDKRGGGQVVNALERDRVRALQLMTQAIPLARQDENHAEVGWFLLSLGEILLNNRGFDEAWRLQYLTDLGQLPDYEEGWGYGHENPGAPVDEEGKPVFHHVPKSFEVAATDGERWRWALEQAVEFSPSLANQVLLHRADFLLQQFGVETMAYYGWQFGRMQTDDTKQNESGTYALHTLGENETIARLADGVKRFELPDEFNYIKLYQQVAEKPDSSRRVDALERLAQIFENRRQYPKAADHWRRCLALGQKKQYQERLNQIVGNWGRFEPMSGQPAGQKGTFEFRYRNGSSVEFVAQEINVQQFLDDVKAYLKSRPREIQWERINIQDLGFLLIRQNQQRYLGRQVASWKLDLKPRENHFDKRVTVTSPVEKAGAYLVTAKMANGNTSRIILWLNDTVIARKAMPEKAWYFVADAVSGQPIAKANVEFFGWRQEHRSGRQFDLLLQQFAEYTDADGQVILDPKRLPNDYQWLVIARTKAGRLAYLGFDNVWYSEYYDAEYEATKVYTITDRPVYRPDQTVEYKFWVRHAKYDQAETSEFAGQEFTLEIHNPKGEKIVDQRVKADEYGGIAGQYKLPADAPLGVYQLALKNYGGSSFRVEEYKKPEYEVTVEAPQEPVMLGEKITATVKANYYFGSPVTKAKVKYKIERTGYTERWYPFGPWDWLYGRGYWWFASDYDWYPGWRAWGCPRPTPFWWPRREGPPELVAQQEVEIGEDGTVKVDIDTAVAKAIHPDEDHQYTITAEVVDQSRRTIVGTGKVLVARKPFKVTAWVDRGYYRTGDVIHAHFSAQTLDGKPVQGPGKLKLLKIEYKDGKPVETPVHEAELPTNAEGLADIQLEAAQPGQYRLSYTLTDAKEHAIEGGYLFTVIGTGFDSADFRFNEIELVPDKAEYQPGEKVKLMINTNRSDGTVLLFLRPANGIYLTPKVIRMKGKSTVEEIDVVQKDMPNFFVEAVTVADGRVYSDVREIVVPPEKRVLTVEVQPSSDSYRPGEKAQVKLKLTGMDGKPFVGSTVVAIYDKSVEYISGGSNVPEIKEFFWKWRRQHHPQTFSSLDRQFYNLLRPNEVGMSDLGVFGGTVPEEGVATDGLAVSQSVVRMNGMGGGMGGRGMAKAARGRAGGIALDAAAPMAAPAAASPAMVQEQEQEQMMGIAADEAPGGGEMVQPTLRTKFADTALWVAALTTADDGTAEVSLDMPENLTTWRIKVWGMGHGTKVGEGATDVVTRKDLIVRMQAPRFFVQKDEVVLSANVHNYLKSDKSVQVVLEMEGNVLEPTDELTRTVQITPNGEARVDWRVKVAREGEAVVRMKALTDEESDAMEMKFPVYVHGMLKMEAFSGALRPSDESGKITVRVPAERRPEQTRLEVRYSPTLAGAMVDALPYLVDYPYGCTEQTLNRFLPTVITQKILIEMGVDLADVRKKQTNLNAQELGDARERAAQWKRYKRNPVFDQEEVLRMVQDGVKALTEMQLSDGGWGWFSGYGEHSMPHTTALVVHGLQIAQQNDVALVPGMLERGVEWLKRYQESQVRELKNALKDPKKDPWKESADNLDALVYMVLVDAGVDNAEMREFLYRDRTKLAVYGMAMFGVALEKQGQKQMLDMVMQNIGQYVQQDDENQTAWLKMPSEGWWYWWGSEYEAHAYYLKLLARTDPKGPLAPRLVKYLLNNRKHATYWNSTRDTALVVEAMADFLRASGESKPEMTVEVWFDGQLQKAVEITPATLFTFDNTFLLEGTKVTDGEHQIELKRKGGGPLYYNAYLTNFTLEDPIQAAGLEIKVQRKYYRLKPVEKSVKTAGARGQAVDQRVEKFEREELADLATLKSGELVEIELEIDSKNDYEYLIFEDMKPAGFEPVDLRSGYTGNAMGAYVEFRDNRVVFFTRTLARGKHSVAYRMRAEIPGKFSALPTRGEAMYAPELKANSAEIKLQVVD
jgi:uncharacterized protein YfaS (alpha-2-macroglobulin family)